MTLIATRRYVDRSQESCLGRSRVVRRARPRLLKPGRRSRRPVAFLVTVVSDGHGGDVEAPDLSPASNEPRPSPVFDVPERRPEAYSRAFRICRGCMQPARRVDLVNGDGDRPRHPECMPAAESDVSGDADA